MTNPRWERYSRQMLFAPLGTVGQQRLAAAKVAIIGCGALGTAQADLLVRAGVGQLTLIDRDVVEVSNLQRQTLFDESDAAAGLPKAAAAQARLQRVNHAVEIQARIADLDPDHAEALLAGHDLLLDGTDNAETRYLVNDFAVAHSLPWVYGAAVGSEGLSFTVIPGETACLECLFPDPSPAPAEADALRPPELMPTCDTAGVLSWVVSWIAALQVSEAVKLLTGHREALRDSLISADLWKNTFRELRHPRRDSECRACAHRDFVFLRGEQRAAVTLCGRNAVQIHEHRRALPLQALAERLRPHGEVRANDFALRFAPAASGQGEPSAPIQMTIFPDGRALIQGTTDPAAARSLYARYIGA